MCFGLANGLRITMLPKFFILMSSSYFPSARSWDFFGWGRPSSQKLRVCNWRSSLIPTTLGVVVLKVADTKACVSLFKIPNSMPEHEIGQMISQ